MNPIVATALAVGIAIAAASITTPSRPASVPFPPESARRGKSELRSIATRVEQQLRMPGFADFAVGVAENESRFNNLAVDSSPSAQRQARYGYANNPVRYGDSGYPASWYTWGTGGWYQMLPTTALADRAWNSHDPMLVFDPVASTFLLAAFVQRVQRNHFAKLPHAERNWLAVRRFLRSNKAGLDWQEQLPGTRGKRERFGRDLEANGIPAGFMYDFVPTNSLRATPSAFESYLRRPS